MLTSKKRELTSVIFASIDIVLVVISFASSYFIKNFLLPEEYRGLIIGPNYYVILLALVIIWYLVANSFNIYKSIDKTPLDQSIWNIVKTNLTGVTALILTVYILKVEDLSRMLLGFFISLNIILTITFRIIAYKIKFRKNKKVHDSKRFLIVGCRDRAKRVINQIKSSEKDFNILGCIDLDKKTIGKTITDNIKVIGVIDDLKDILTREVVDEVIFAMPLKEIKNVDMYMLLIEMIGVNVRIFPDWHIYTFEYKPSISSVKYDLFAESPTILFSPTEEHNQGKFLKSFLDFSAALIILLLSLPMFLLVALSIIIFSPGPIFFKQERVGLNGRKFKLIKFRSMVTDAEKKLAELKKLNEMDGPAFKMKEDPRIIPVIGTFIRKTGLDELPQLINIMKGEMSIVGPRPPLAAEVEEYEIWQRRKLSVKPGLTCLWQIAPRRNDLTFNQWMDLDLQYIDRWSIKLDVIIIFRTFLTVITGSGR